jgi:predicted SAM-dependent methyltransferase
MGLGLGLRTRIRNAFWKFATWRRQRPRVHLSRRRVEKLHIGCGPEVIATWFNIDLKAYPGVDLVCDVRDGLPFEGVQFIFAEHFLEHIYLDEGVRFLRECRNALADNGVLRVSTPNIEWVMKHLTSAIDINKAFHGWGHKFLYDRNTLAAALKAAGFTNIRFHRYGESDHAELRGLERHEQYEDSDDVPHVLIAEASGRGPFTPAEWSAHDEYSRAIYD